MQHPHPSLNNITLEPFIYHEKHRKKLWIILPRKQDVDPRRDDDASPMSSYRCMLRPTWMFMDRMIAPINVHSIS